MSLRTFTDAYIECALWCSVAYGVPEDNGTGSFDTSMQSYGFGADDLAPAARAAMEADCRDFYAANAHLLLDCLSRCSEDEQAGHDFWLTRNRHGAGFWDGDWPAPAGATLTEMAHAYGECDVYVGDDGLIYLA